MRKTLEGKVAIITGGGTGIGAACADMFAAEGAHVVVTGRTLETISNVAKRNGGTAIQCDVSKYDDVVSMFQKAKAIKGTVDVLVNNAGGPGPVAAIADVDVVEWQRCAEINLFGAMYCMKEAAKIMCAQKSGSIINMSSLMGIQGYPMRSAYSATKFALVGMTEAVAREVGPDNVRVNALMPGAVSGENMDRILDRRAEAEGRPVEDIVKENYTDPAALKRWVTPEEVAKTALFYASDASSAITGDKMKVCCGRF
ncbi:MAG: SDR family oxidoreductase [Emcibacteraceae bacterium]|nr:SDR family oxidoreductase [Emcibacteraceae bacterium]